MDVRDAKNVRALLLIAYLLLAFVFTVAAIAGGIFFQKESARRIADSESRSSAILSARESMEGVWGAAIYCALHPDRAQLENMLRRTAELRDAASSIADTMYGIDDARRAVASEFQAAAGEAVAVMRAGLRDKTPPENLIREFFPVLDRGAKALLSLENLQAERAGDFDFFAQKTFWKLNALLIAFFLLSFLLAFFGFALLTRTLRRSLQSLCEGTRELRTGNLEYRFREITPDEIGQVKYDFNMMARRISLQSGNLRAANEELRGQAEKLIAAHQHKDRFLSNMSHELRTPLNSIIGFSELIEQRPERLNPEKLHSYASRILSAAEHLLDLITSLLDLAKSGAGTLKAVPSEFNLASAVRDTAALLAPLAEKKSLEVKLDLPEELLVTADQRMIKQIFINLFSNAVKYTEHGSISVSLRKEKDSAVLDVADTGIGIASEEREHLFTDFYRVDNGPDFMVDGIGIGLALSRRLAALHSGEISFVSERGKGSTFTLRFPVLPPAEKTDEKSASATER